MSATPMPYNVRYDANLNSLVYEFPTGWIQIPNSAIGTVWGDITGTLSNQTDLQTALNAKAPLASPAFTGTVALSATTTVPGSSVAVVKPAVDNTNAKFNLYQSDGSTIVACFDLHQRRLGLATATPGKLLDVNGDASVAGVMTVGSVVALPSLSTTVINSFSPSEGWLVEDSTLHKLKFYNGTAWETVTSA